MRSYPINDLNKCSVKNCLGKTVTIIQKTIGTEKIMFGYCEFHSMISETIFTVHDDRKIIPFMRMND
jgi:hypothetical protein